jgi:DNA-binding XRE family transcriptional regulator
MILLRKLRQEKGLSINKLAREVNVNSFVIANIENKQYKAATKSMKKLADYFGIKEPLDLTESVWDLIKVKSCLNQRCPLNKEKYCQSEQVIAGASCESQDLVTDKSKKAKYNDTRLLFIN